MWRPYLASAALDPFANGVWAWYPGAGYSWVSPYPWGWTPFHSGSWNYCSNGGWGWQPGGQWTGIANYQTALNPARCTTCPRPPLAPVAGQSTLVVVNTKPLAVSRLSSSDTFVFHKDSAGLGVPRESFGKLDKISAGVAQHGSVSTPAFVSNPGGGPNAHENNSWAASHNAEVQNRSNTASSHADQAPRSSGSWSNASHTSSPNQSSRWRLVRWLPRIFTIPFLRIALERSLARWRQCPRSPLIAPLLPRPEQTNSAMV